MIVQLISTGWAFVSDHAGWIAINVGVPVLLPYLMIFHIAIIQWADGTGGGLRLQKKSVENGQLFWIVISMLAATSYDAISALDSHPNDARSIWTSH